MEVRVKCLSLAERDIVKRYWFWLAEHHIDDRLTAGDDVYVNEEPILGNAGEHLGTTYRLEVWLPEDTL
jgi:hypothetical protein